MEGTVGRPLREVEPNAKRGFAHKRETYHEADSEGIERLLSERTEAEEVTRISALAVESQPLSSPQETNHLVSALKLPSIFLASRACRSRALLGPDRTWAWQRCLHAVRDALRESPREPLMTFTTRRSSPSHGAVSWRCGRLRLRPRPLVQQPHQNPAGTMTCPRPSYGRAGRAGHRGAASPTRGWRAKPGRREVPRGEMSYSDSTDEAKEHERRGEDPAGLKTRG